MPIEPALLFYPKFAYDSRARPGLLARLSPGQGAGEARVERSRAVDYLDDAIRPLGDNELKAMDLFHETRGGEAAVAKIEQQDAMIESVRASAA